MTAGRIARVFHEATKHTVESVQRGGRTMDWGNKPHPFKVYGRELPTAVPPDDLHRVLRYGAGVLRKQEYGGETLYFRTYASAGALYPVELYVVSDGVHHFDPLHFRLERLRAEGVHGGTALVLTGIPWRTCWKYGDRGYRHLWWDAGTILANITALSSSARVVLGFHDEALARLVDVDGVSEFPLCVVELEEGSDLDARADFSPLGLPVRPLSPREERFPAIGRVHAAGNLRAGAVAEWGGASWQADPWDDVEHVIRRRGSARVFGSAPMPNADLRQILARASAGAGMIRPYLAVHNVEGLEPGTYVWEDGELRPLRAGVFRSEAAYLCLGQRLGGMGAATIFLMADLEDVLGRFGDRGYRAIQLEGGTTLGRLDLAAHSLGWGATGLTFFDDDVTAFFSPHAASLECMVVCAVGERRGRRLPLA